MQIRRNIFFFCSLLLSAYPYCLKILFHQILYLLFGFYELLYRLSQPFSLPQIQYRMPCPNQIKFINIKMQQNQSKLELASSPPTPTILPLKDTQIIVINPNPSPNSQPQSQTSSIIFQSKDSASVQSTSIRDSAKIYTYEQMQESEEIQYEEENESMRKLYKQMKRQEHKKEVMEKEIMFLYQSQREEEVIKEEEPYQEEQQQESQEEDQLQIIVAKDPSDVLYRVIPKNKMIECLVKVASTSFLSMEKHIQLYLLNEKRLLLRAKKSKLNVASQFSVEKSDGRKVAVFQSNLSRKQYKYKANIENKQTIKESKQKYTETTYDSSLIKLNPIKVQLSSIESPQKCYLIFRPNLLGTRQQRVKIIKPKTKVFKSERFSDIKSSYENFQYDRLEIFQNKLAEKNLKGQLMLDFKTKNMMESAKNMMIEDENGAVCLSFYKRRENIYMLTVIHPFNIVQAFFVAVSNLDHLFF